MTRLVAAVFLASLATSPAVAQTFCSVFDEQPCLPEFDVPLGGDLRLTVEDRTDAAASAPGGEVNTIRDMFSALRGCWAPPERNKARQAMTISVRLAFKRNGEILGRPHFTYVSPDTPEETRDIYREAVRMALQRCAPLPFTAGLGAAIAGRPISIRFIDNRNL